MWIVIWRNFLTSAPHLPSGFSSVMRYLKKRKGSHHTCISLSSSLVKRVKHPGEWGGFKEVLFRHGKVGWVRNSWMHGWGRGWRTAMWFVNGGHGTPRTFPKNKQRTVKKNQDQWLRIKGRKHTRNRLGCQDIVWEQEEQTYWNVSHMWCQCLL